MLCLYPYLQVLISHPAAVSR